MTTMQNCDSGSRYSVTKLLKFMLIYVSIKHLKMYWSVGIL